MTPETIMIEPINKAKLEKLFEQTIPKAENQRFIIENDCIYIRDGNGIIISQDACFGRLHEKYNKDSKKSELEVSFGIRMKTKTDEGWFYPMHYEYEISFFISELRKIELFDPPISLKDFMGSRYNYNPRIKGNVKGLVRFIKTSLDE